MELVPLDPEVSEPGGEPAPAADDPGSPQRRGSSRRLCSVAGAREGASALRSLAPSSAPPPSASGVCKRRTVPPSAGEGIRWGAEPWPPSHRTPRTHAGSCRGFLH